MKLSHSSLKTILIDPVSYYLGKVQGISLKVKKPALAIGSNVHWGIENNTCDLEELFKEKGSFKQKDNYTQDEMLAEGMIYGYLKHKDELFDEILKDIETGEKLELLEETHELYINGRVKSNLPGVEPHEFVGIIDLLLLTNKGFIIIDYKTSSKEPDWDKYLDQIYRYIMLIEQAFPDVPIYKIGIINIKKTSIRQKKNENEIQFAQRIKLEYELNDENYVNYHEYSVKELNRDYIKEYIKNLSVMCDVAYNIEKNKMFYINYSEQNNIYGKSEFYDIIYHTPDAHILYQISDFIWDEENQQFVDNRDCIAFDMKVLDNDNCLNKFNIFEKEANEFFEKSKLDVFKHKKEFFTHLNKKYLTDNSLLDKYLFTLNKKLKSVNF